MFVEDAILMLLSSTMRMVLFYPPLFALAMPLV